ncbi:MAG: methyltransferase domain-containing protein [Gammaproteobacteria bacterium]|nr:methyltransferase domain-containing protein [Gammaproteobacteria bacterium]
MTRATRLDPAPPWTDAGQHPMSPVITHDDAARFNFLANFNKYMSGVVVAGNAVAYAERAAPRWQREHGALPANRREVREAMATDPYYQMWSALRRTGMEMRQQAGRALVLRQAVELRDRARALNAGALNAGAASTLQLDPTVAVPRYQSELDNHCMPGSYYAEHIEDDVSAAANYDAGMFATTTGLFGRFLDGAGRGTARWLQARRPGWTPRRILDLGCGLGHNTLPLARAFPQAEVVAVDLAAPMLRYGHARAVGLGVACIRFQQANAEALPFADGAFDFIYSTMFLHETSHAALRNILREVRRLLAPGGLHVHLEQPPYRGMDLFEQFLRDWDCQHNNEPFWSALHETDLPAVLRQLGFAPTSIFEAQIHADVEDEMPKVASEVEDYGRGGMWYACGADA